MCKYSFGFLARRSSRMLRQISDKVSALERCREQDSAEYEERKKKLALYISKNINNGTVLTPAARQIAKAELLSLGIDVKRKGTSSLRKKIEVGRAAAKSASVRMGVKH